MSPLPDGAEDAQLSAALAAAAGLTPVLPKPLEEHPNHLQVQDAIPVVAFVEGQGQGQGQGGEGEAGLPSEPKLEPGAAEAAATPTPEPRGPKNKKPRDHNLPLSPHQALHFAPRGIYVDVGGTGQLRCSCNHKPCGKWDSFKYNRHFGFKVHRRYEEERLDDEEIRRLREAKAAYLRLHPMAEEPSLRRKRRTRDGEKVLSVDELRVQERHWMAMWKDAKNELRQLRQELKGEADEEVRGELMADIQGLKRRKGDWARLLGLTEARDFSVNL